VNEPVWLHRDTVMAVQEQLLSAFGGLSGIQDKRALEDALIRPEVRFVQGDPTLFDLAASYGFGILRKRPFKDGNKRLGFALAVLFIELNGYRFTATEADAALRTLAFAAEAMDEADYSAWLAANSRPLSNDRAASAKL
jgi:death-on-curing protein